MLSPTLLIRTVRGGGVVGGQHAPHLQDSRMRDASGSPRPAAVPTDRWVLPGALGGRTSELRGKGVDALGATPSHGECGWPATGQLPPGRQVRRTSPCWAGGRDHSSSRAGFPGPPPPFEVWIKGEAWGEVGWGTGIFDRAVALWLLWTEVIPLPRTGKTRRLHLPEGGRTQEEGRGSAP